MTAMVVSYSRAFTRSDGWPKLPKELLELYSEDEIRIHRRTLELRHKLYAHSDAVNYGVIPFQSDWHTDIQMHPVFELPHEEISAIKAMCRKMILGIKQRMIDIKQSYLIDGHD
ncbi:hypothetical protein G6L41_026685 (plasmid) [Agrobacterium tumefaciens]|uniref:hypothetical protein n=1 Tax=Agrobacterium tumefaciens TaxID=358 RepID=UPI0015736BD2|nr:hypothetical protein [Agrobacterium tumefaciens]WCK17141.1 hypothetical protein G6L41_026685 [Agrobacterium tumefaciens]